MTQVTVNCQTCEKLMGVPVDEQNNGHVCAACLAVLWDAVKINDVQEKLRNLVESMNGMTREQYLELYRNDPIFHRLIQIVKQLDKSNESA